MPTSASVPAEAAPATSEASTVVSSGATAKADAGDAPNTPPPELKTTVVIGQAPYQFGTPERNVSIFGQ